MDNENDFKCHSIRVINATCRNLISSLLNIRKDLPQVTEDGRIILRDWRGLAELIGMDYTSIRRLLTASDPTLQVLEWFENRSDNNIDKLVNYLEMMDRYDVVDDALDLMIKDAQLYGSMGEVTELLARPQLLNNERLQTSSNSIRVQIRPDETRILTADDTLDQVKIFDAYLCYDESDVLFARDVTKRLEEDYGLSLFVKDRNLLHGHVELDVLFKIIQERCNRMIVICSPSFVSSPTCKSVLSLAQCLSMSQMNRYIVPVIYKHCALPPQLQYLSKLDFTKVNVFANLWDQLANSVKILTTVASQQNLPRQRESVCEPSTVQSTDVKTTWESETPGSSSPMNTNKINEAIKQSRKLNNTKFKTFKNSLMHMKQNVQNSLKKKEKAFSQLGDS